MNWEEKQRQRREARYCPHCRSLASHVACVKCMRDMCEDCISLWPDLGYVCGLCYDHLSAVECLECGAELPSVGYGGGYCDKCQES